MGEVYRARDPRLERDVAIKVLPERFAADPDLRLRFEREAKAAAALSHPHICPIFDIGFDRGLQFIGMEYLDGETLADRAGHGMLPLDVAVEHGAQIADALVEAHHHGVIHRDLKPSNVMLVRSGVKVVDFGVAKFRASLLSEETAAVTAPPDTVRGVLLGTLQYMAPEQLEGEDIDTGVDVFALGVLLYEMVTGVAPFAADSPASTIAAILDREPPAPSSFNPNVPAALDRLIVECLAKQRAYRPTAEVAVQRLRAIHGVNLARVTPDHVRNRPKTIRSVAVLPFAATLRTEGEDAFTEGMTEGLIVNLGSLPSLRVISQASARRYKGSDRPIQAIASELRVDAVLRGDIVENAPGRFAVQVDLIGGTDGACIWSGRFDCERSDVLNVEEQIAHAVATNIRLSGAVRHRRARRPRLNAECHEAYLRGRFQLDNRLGNWFEKSFEALSAAITHDRSFAPAHAALSRWFLLAALRATTAAEPSPYAVEWREGCQKAEDESRLAVKLDPALADGHAALAQVLFFRWRFEESEDAYRRALELGPSIALIHATYSLLLSVTNRHDAAIAHAEIAREHDPLATYVYERLAYDLYHARRFDACLEACRVGLNLNPREGVFYYFRGLAHGMRGELEEATANLAVAYARMPNSSFLRASLAAAFSRADLTDAASRILDDLEQAGADPIARAEIYVTMGRSQEAMDALERAFESESPQLLGVLTDPAFAALHSHPRFRRLLHGLRIARFFALDDPPLT
jgi:serine/threonine protein kinase/tetratricopeptide (TPR) repeat protein